MRGACGPAKLAQDRRQEESGRVPRNPDAHVNDGAEPDLPVGQDATVCVCVQCVHARRRSGIGAGAVVCEAQLEKLFLLWGQEPAVLGPVSDQEKGDYGDEGGDGAFDDENPTPAS